MLLLDGAHRVLALMIHLEALHDAGHDRGGWHVGIPSEAPIPEDTRIGQRTGQGQSLHKGIGVDSRHLGGFQETPRYPGQHILGTQRSKAQIDEYGFGIGLASLQQAVHAGVTAGVGLHGLHGAVPQKQTAEALLSLGLRTQLRGGAAGLEGLLMAQAARATGGGGDGGDVAQGQGNGGYVILRIWICILLQVGGILQIVGIHGGLLALELSAPAQRLAGRKVMGRGQVIAAPGQLELSWAGDLAGSALKVATAVRALHGVVCCVLCLSCVYMVDSMSFLRSRLLGLQALLGHIWQWPESGPRCRLAQSPHTKRVCSITKATAAAICVIWYLLFG